MIPPSSIPLVDLKLQHERIAGEVREGFDRVLAETSFILGPEVERFERAFAEYCGIAHCMGVGNGTDAIELALRACGIGRGHEVVIPANTFVATAEAVVRTGADVVLADCDEAALLDAEAVADAVTARTRAVIAVHLYGQIANMKGITEAAGDRVVVEDAAQSQGAMQYGQRAGSLGLAAGTSFYPGKNLGAYGDAGAVLTSDHEVAERIQMLRNHGGVRKYEHVAVGVNSRLDGLQAVVLSAKLARLDAWNQERVAAAARYDQLLAEVDQVRRPTLLDGNDHVWHLYVVRVPRRDDVLARLNAAGIGASVHYPAPIHRLPAFAGLDSGRTYPVAERLAKEILSLPLYPGITDDQQQRVVDELVRALAS